MTHFRIADLLLATTLAVVYTVGAQWLTPPTHIVNRVLLFAPLALMPTAVIGLAVHARRRLGRSAVTWRGRYWWAPHAAFVALFVVGVAWSRWAEVSISILVPMGVAHHVLFFAMTPITLGEAGLLAGPTLLRRRDYALELDDGGRQLQWRVRPGVRGRPFAPFTGKVNVPASKVDAIRDALEALPNDTEASDA